MLNQAFLTQFFAMNRSIHLTNDVCIALFHFNAVLHRGLLPLEKNIDPSTFNYTKGDTMADPS